jgi:N-acetyl sugar amidotransferase
MKYCKKCLFPDTKPDLCFDAEGICDACHSGEKRYNTEKGIDWEARAKEFESIIRQYRSKDGMKYDCIVPVSGGKDSFFQVYAMKHIHKMNPLAVTFFQYDQTTIGDFDLKILQQIGVDHIGFTLNPKVSKKLAKKGYEIVGDCHWVSHTGIFTVPAKIAVNFNIPLLIWGENPQLEYGGPAAAKEKKVLDKRWRQEFAGMRGFREEDMADEDLPLSDLKALLYPSDEDLQRVGVTGLFYGYFFKWDYQKNMEFAKTFGWKPLDKPWPGAWFNYENCDTGFQDLHDHFKWVKYGFGRATDHVNMLIRKGELTREEGVQIVREYDGKLGSKKEFCEYIEMSEEEFDKIRDTFVNKDIFRKDENGEWVLKELPY